MLIERDCATQKADRVAGLLVWEDFGVGQAGGVVDGDMHGVPSLRAAADAGGVGACALAVVAIAAGDPLASAALDAAELLDVDVDELTGPLAFIANHGRQPDPAES